MKGLYSTGNAVSAHHRQHSCHAGRHVRHQLEFRRGNVSSKFTYFNIEKEHTCRCNASGTEENLNEETAITIEEGDVVRQPRGYRAFPMVRRSMYVYT